MLTIELLTGFEHGTPVSVIHHPLTIKPLLINLLCHLNQDTQTLLTEQILQSFLCGMFGRQRD